MSAAEFLPPDDMSLETAGQVLARRFGALDGRVVRGRRRFYDTFDGLVRGAGLSLVHERGSLLLLERETGLVRERLLTARPRGRRSLFARELPDGPLRVALTGVSEPRALLPLVSVRVGERPLEVRDEERKLVARLALCEASVNGATLRPRVVLTGVRGYDDALAAVRAALVDELGFTAADQPLVDEAVRACGGVPGGVSSKPDVALRFEERGDQAAAAVLRRLLEVMRANLDGTLADVDSEFLHDFRVAVRRTRSVQRELRDVFPAAELEQFRAGFRWLQQVTGDSRDLDVYVLEFERFRGMVPPSMAGDLQPLLEVLRTRRAGAHRAMNRALRSEAAQTLVAEWSAWLDALAEGSSPGAAAGRPIGELAGERIRVVYRRMRRMGEAIDASSPAEAYHELRKKGKELRYLLELFGAPLYPSEVVRPMVRTLKALQDVLGRHQDREIQIATLHSLADEVAGMPRGSQAVLAMGALIARLSEDEQAARAAFAERFAAFTSEDSRRLVKETFG